MTPQPIRFQLITNMTQQSFINYVLDFYGPDGLYPEGFNELQIAIALGLYKGRLASMGRKFEGDTVDREAVRDIILNARKQVTPEFAKNT
jgi:hypothetical protein